MGEQLQQLMNDICDWSDDQFGFAERNPSILYHLKKEVDELIEKVSKLKTIGLETKAEEILKQLDEVNMKYVDCFMLLLDSASHYGLRAEQLIELSKKKLEINKSRK